MAKGGVMNKPQVVRFWCSLEVEYQIVAVIILMAAVLTTGALCLAIERPPAAPERARQQELGWSQNSK